MSSNSISQKDYYQILELNKNCSQEEISESYRNLSLKYHPKVTKPENSAIFEYHFQKLAEAYEVLSDPYKKEIFDIYGLDGLNNGIIEKNGKKFDGYKFMGNGHEIFEKFMGTSNPFTLIRESDKKIKETIIIDAAKNEKENEINSKNEKNININLECTLEELYNGCIKNVKYKKQKICEDLRTTEEKEENIEVEIMKGYDKSIIIPFKEMGNDFPGEKSSDLIIHITEKKHPLFKRVNKNDLIYTHEITLAQALNSYPVRLNTLDNRKIAVSIDEIISPQTIKKVPGEGMPIYQKDISVRDLTEKKGDLYIKFHIIFPEYIEPSKKQEIIKLLDKDE